MLNKNIGYGNWNSWQVKFLAILVILIGQNLLIFWPQYFKGSGFPWDFVGTYLAVPYYWINAVSHGFNASWIPFQGMGYPLYMNLQSGYYYLPNWIFVLLNISYTVNVATYFQCFHVLIGAIGAFYCAKAYGLSWQNSLLAGVIYQTFGGFYSNAEHLDIVRGFAFLPWIFSVVYVKDLKWDNIYFLLSALMLPLWIYLMTTGGYLGMLIAACFILSIIAITRAIIERKVLIILFIFMMIGIGFLLAGYFLVPALLFMKELERGSATNIYHEYLKVIDVYSFIFKITYKELPHDISMRSLSIGCVSMLFIFLGFRVKSVKQCYMLLLAIIISYYMSDGILHQWIIKYIHPLGLSRADMSDYKGIIGLNLILLSLQMKENIVIGKKYAYRSMAYLGFVLSGAFFLKIIQDHLYFDLMSIIIISVFIYLIVTLVKNKNVQLALLIMTSIVDWYRIHYHQIYDDYPDIISWQQNTYGNYSINEQKLQQRLMPSDKLRPERQVKKDMPWSYKGYYTGDYMMYDYGGSNYLNRYIAIHNDKSLDSFAQESWQVRSFENNKINFESNVLLRNNIKLIKYGTDFIKIQVSSDKPLNMVENEIYWPGWTANITANNIKIPIITQDIQGFRGWSLPSGSYILEEHFEIVTRNISKVCVILGIIAWLLTAVLYFKGYRDVKA